MFQKSILEWLSACGAAFLVLPKAVALHCEPFDLSASDEHSQFENILRQTPFQILAPARHALMLLSRESQQVGEVEAFAHAEALSEYGRVLQAVYKQSGDESLLRALLTVRQGALDLAPGPAPLMVLRLADALFDLCRSMLRSAQRSLALFLQAEEISGQMCNAKVVLLYKQLGQWVEGEKYAKKCGLSITHLHLQHPRLQTMPWWNLEDPRLPKWLRGMRFRHAVHIIRTDLQKCLERTPSAFDDSANDWFFVGSRFKWTGLNLMHSARGGWNERWCGEQACAKRTCDMLRWRKELNHSLWPKLSQRAGITSESSPPMYVNFYALTPGSHILPHLGHDGRVTIHLALLVPPGNQSRIRVANQTINYTHAGQMLVFDDAYDHEVWNDGKTTRYVLGVTIWHPSLLIQLPPSEIPPEVPASHFTLSWRTSPESPVKQKPKPSDRTARSSICRGRVICAGGSRIRKNLSTMRYQIEKALACIRLLDVPWVA
ncbi:Asph [Symbiodinium sp. CCMP2592]|nr:Asph [Symbiodinium sp. CCMP2592]